MFYPYEGGSPKTCDHLLTLMSSQTCMTFFCKNTKDYTGNQTILVNFDFHCIVEKNTAICIRIFNFMFHRRWKVMHIWNDTWVSKWLQNWYFGVISLTFIPVEYFVYYLIGTDMQMRYHCEMVYVSFCRLLVTIFLSLVSIFQIRLFFY